MIRRADGAEAWILISQIDHAQLAARLAAHWRGPAADQLEPRLELLAAIEHHDDGWAGWEAKPGVDDVTGRPLAFDEMLLGESLAIWRHSITAAEAFGPLAAYCVAGHFCALLERFDSCAPGGPAKQKLAESFLAYFAKRRAAWLAQCEATDPARLSRRSPKSPTAASAICNSWTR